MAELPSITDFLNRVDPDCARCHGEGLVCEDHHHTAWGDGYGCCGGAGQPCMCTERCVISACLNAAHSMHMLHRLCGHPVRDGVGGPRVRAFCLPHAHLLIYPDKRRKNRPTPCETCGAVSSITCLHGLTLLGVTPLIG